MFEWFNTGFCATPNNKNLIKNWKQRMKFVYKLPCWKQRKNITIVFQLIIIITICFYFFSHTFCLTIWFYRIERLISSNYWQIFSTHLFVRYGIVAWNIKLHSIKLFDWETILLFNFQREKSSINMCIALRMCEFK